jgi:hypothetical protein
LNARELANWLSAAQAEWELFPGLPFPTEQEHAETCAALGVRSSDPETSSREYRQRLRQVRALRTSLEAIGPTYQGVEDSSPLSVVRRTEDLAALSEVAR